MLHPISALAGAIFYLGILSGAIGQSCTFAWTESTLEVTGVDGYVNAMTLFDDGAGTQLYLAGEFQRAGLVAGTSSVRFNGWSWSAVGSFTGTARDFAVFDAGSGPELFVCGEFPHPGGTYSKVMRWTGNAWAHVADAAGSVWVLEVFNDGSGPALVAAGGFTDIGGVSANRVAKWNGTTWSPLGAGVSSGVRALRAYDDGSGEKLYVGGCFATAGSVTANHIAVWSNGTWSGFGAGLSPSTGTVRSIEFHDDGNGTALYVGGEFSGSGATPLANVAKWTGTAWVALGAGAYGGTPTLTPSVNTLRTVDLDGPGGAAPLLVAGGTFFNAGTIPVKHLAAWNGTAWTTALGQGVDGYFVSRVGKIPTPAGDIVLIAGYFGAVDGIAVGNVAARISGVWSSLNGGTSIRPASFPDVPDGGVASFAIWNDGSGPKLYGAGYVFLGGLPVGNYVVRWNGSAFSAFGAPFNDEIDVIKVLDLGSGPEMYAGGNFTAIGGAPAGRVAHWNGAAWVPVGTIGSPVHDLAVYDSGSGPRLVAATEASVVEWNGSAWTPVAGAPTGVVNALEVFDPPGPQGPVLYAGGSFAAPALFIASWNGTTWSAVGGGLGSSSQYAAVRDLLAFDDGTGLALYAGGKFETAGGASAQGVARWNGSSWTGLDGATPLGSGSLFGVVTMGVFDDGTGPRLCAGGPFGTPFTFGPPKRIAKWTGADWVAIAGGIDDGLAFAIQGFDDGKGPGLFVGGQLYNAGGQPQRQVGKIGCAGPRIQMFQNGGPGSGLSVQNQGLVPSHEYYNFFSIEPCSQTVGNGPYLGLCASSPAFLLQQLALPIGATPFHFVYSSAATFGPFVLPPMTIDALCIDWTGGGPGAFSRVTRVVVQ